MSLGIFLENKILLGRVNMKNTYIDLFKMIKGSLKIEKDNLSEGDIDWDEILKLSSEHKIVPMVYEAVNKTENFQSLNPEMKNIWKSYAMQNIFSQVQRSNRFLQIYNEFNKSNIKVLVFKGIILRELYPVPDERVSGDEDMLVNKEDLQTCLDILEKNGLERVLSEEDDADVYHYFCNKTGLHLELHTNLFGKGKSAYSHMNNIFTDVFEDADIININGVDVSTFSLDKHFLYVICHAIKHFVGCGTGIRQLCDICMYIEAYYDKINWNYIWKEIKTLGYDTLFVNFLQVGIDYLGLDENKVVYVKDKSNYYINTYDLIEDIMEGGIYGASTQARLNAANMSLDALSKESKSKVKSNLAAIFPKTENLKGRYEYLEKYPFLLPVAWGDRIIKYVKDRGSLSEVKHTAKETIEVGNKRIDLLKKYKLI